MLISTQCIGQSGMTYSNHLPSELKVKTLRLTGTEIFGENNIVKLTNSGTGSIANFSIDRYNGGNSFISNLMTIRNDDIGFGTTSPAYGVDINKTFRVTGQTLLPANTSIGSVTSTELGHISGLTSNAQFQINSKLNYSTAANTYAPKITNDTTTLPVLGSYRLALTQDSVFKVINSEGKVYPLITREEKWVLKPIAIDSTISSYTIVQNQTQNFLYASTESFTDISYGKYKIYTSNLFYYLPKNLANYTISINLPNPNILSSAGLKINILMNKRCTINFNYPINFTLKNGVGGLTVDTDFATTQMRPTLQSIPGTNFKASWFVSHDSSIYTFYVDKQKWYIQ